MFQVRRHKVGCVAQEGVSVGAREAARTGCRSRPNQSLPLRRQVMQEDTLGDGGGRRLQEVEVGPVLRVAVLGAEVTSEHKLVGLKCAANRQLSDAFLCLVCFNTEGEQPSFERCGMKLSSNSDCEVDLFRMPRCEFRDELDVLAVAEILLRFFLFLPVIADVRRPRKFQDAQLLLGSDGSPESHSVGSFVQEISYVLRARVEPLSAKEFVYLIVNLVDLQRRLRLCSDVADDIFDGPLLDHRTGDNRWEFPLGSLGWARSR